MDPLTALLLAQAGGELISRLMPSANSPFQQSVKQRMGYGQRLMPELMSEAMGTPSMATRALQRNLGEEVNRAQQSYSASRQSAAPTMKSLTTPVREGQGRFQEAKIRGYADIAGQGQRAAQSQIMNAYNQATPEQLALEMQEKQGYSDLMSGIANIVGKYKGYQQDAEFKSIYQPIIKKLLEYLQIDFGILPQAQIQGVDSSQYWNPSQYWNNMG